tara:strand:+ start:2149 stop:2460 length:312 start_codon:yes stop_codon:yes gene_type:complete
MIEAALANGLRLAELYLTPEPNWDGINNLGAWRFTIISFEECTNSFSLHHGAITSHPPPHPSLHVSFGSGEYGFSSPRSAGRWCGAASDPTFASEIVKEWEEA